MSASKQKAANKISKNKLKNRSRTYLEVILSSLTIYENGNNNHRDSAGAILFKWLYPRPGKQSLTAIIPFTGLRDSQNTRQVSIDFSDKAKHGEPYLFKEKTEGPSVITAEVAITKNTGLISKIIKSAFSIGIKQVSNPYASATLGVILDNAGLSHKTARVIGRTSFNIDHQQRTGIYQGRLFIPESFNIYNDNSNFSNSDDIDNTETEKFVTGSFNGLLHIKIR